MNVVLSLCLITLLGAPETGNDYEALVLPYAAHGLADWASTPERPRPVINVTFDGVLHASGRVLEGMEHLQAFLAATLQHSPDAPLLLRVDLVGEFSPVLKLFTAARTAGFEEVHLAVGDIRHPRLDEDGSLLPCAEPVHYLPLPADEDWEEGEGVPPPGCLRVRVETPGRKLEATHASDEPWKGVAGTRFRWDLTQREVSYRIGGFETRDRRALLTRLNGMGKLLRASGVELDLGPGVTVAEAVFVLDTLRGLGVEHQRFVSE